ncbi:hypothetical protein GCM10010168_92090 [Actinoplanes ianthinogenes]|uniref:Uncharacterized protein n=1 Tax=Actinoplanes ianthinogenes TaxID=122358 RepID=A0ABM7LNB7_9ACTN|nr:hypothetical protein [Actinoplanes ianthinogenes]BCJ40767.1 hypothetical protein Aiant_14240 [Actinoplanes ianthinogenes]GGR58705.1 hypothetical protein GCM10010168_92090 [Actinoplanes ianthinogenes]
MRPLAHGVGGSSDLPLPLDLVLQAGAATVVLSFLIAALWWTTPRLGGGVPRSVRTAGWLPVLRGLVLLLSLYLVGNALLGPAGGTNPAAYAIFVWLWVGLVPLSVVSGPVWRAVNPLRTLFRVLRLPAAGLRPGPGWGMWPAVGWLLAFVWFELVAPGRTEPRVIGWCLVGYAVAQLGMAALRGEEWFARGDCFEVYSSLAGRLSPVRWPRPLSGLAAPFPVAGVGLTAFVAVWWGSTVFDSASGSPVWAGFVQRAGHPAVVATGALVLICAGVLLAVRRTAGGLDVTASLIPIAVGYTLAHYLSLLIVAAPRGVLLLGQQWGLWAGVGWNVVPIPGVIAGAQVALILAGHVVGVIVAHDAALAGGSRRSLVSSRVAGDGSSVAGDVSRVAGDGSSVAGDVSRVAGDGSPVAGDASPVAGEAIGGAARPARQARPVLVTLADELPLVLFMIGCTWAGLFLLFVR